jgi:aspartyl-tRNA(Asn)/glutamyl-tRNA(Gln) amidotransferase subunit A
MLNGYISPFEATVVAQLRARGGVVLGKTNLDEFGMGSHSTHSAHGPVSSSDPATTPAHSVGGSSGGSAVAVANGDADVALGTDTGGSVRLPAAYTGVVGFKPSYGMLSRYGVVPYANSLDTVGLLARNVGDIARLVVGEGGLFAEHDPNDPTSLSEATRKRCGAEREGYGKRYNTAADGKTGALFPLAGLRFGIPLEYNVEELAACVKDAWITAATRLQDLGAHIVPVRLPSTRHALSAYYVIAPAEASSNLAKYDGVRYGRPAAPASPSSSEGSSTDNSTGTSNGNVLYAATRGANLGDEVQRRIVLGAYTLSSEAMDNYFIQAQRVRRLVRRDFDRVFSLPNPLLSDDDAATAFDLADMAEDVELADKRGPPPVDFLLCPTAPTLAPLLSHVASQTPLDAYVNDVFTVPASLAGLPAVSVPVPVSVSSADRVQKTQDAQSGSPGFAGMQLIGQFWDDARLLAVAESVSEVLSGPSATCTATSGSA